MYPNIRVNRVFESKYKSVLIFFDNQNIPLFLRLYGRNAIIYITVDQMGIKINALVSLHKKKKKKKKKKKTLWVII